MNQYLSHKDINGKHVQVGDVILYPQNSCLSKHIVLRETKGGTLVVSDKIIVPSYDGSEPYSRWKHAPTREWRRTNVSTHNSFLYKTYMPDFIIVDHIPNLDLSKYSKSLKQFENEQKAKISGQVSS